jgi:hypothetical protein
MSISLKNIERVLKRLMPILLPEEVVDIDFELEPYRSSTKNNEYYFGITYVLPDDSDYLKIDNDPPYKKWNHQIRKTIENTLDIEIIINSTGFRSLSYHLKNKK